MDEDSPRTVETGRRRECAIAARESVAHREDGRRGCEDWGDLLELFFDEAGDISWHCLDVYMEAKIKLQSLHGPLLSPPEYDVCNVQNSIVLQLVHLILSDCLCYEVGHSFRSRGQNTRHYLPCSKTPNQHLSNLTRITSCFSWQQAF